jgi:glutathione synthase/RimK-type ligase-like ATP-grasp enzyme
MIWIKAQRNDINSIEPSPNIIYVSEGLADKLKTQTKLIFGQKEIAIKVQVLSSIPQGLGTKFEDPAPIRFSPPVFEDLLIQESAVYQIHYTETSIHIGPVIGFLLGDQHYYYHHRRLKGLTDAMGIYEKVGGLFIAFRHCSISWLEKCIYGLYFNYETQKWQYGKLPLPSVVYRRCFNSKSNFINEKNDLVNWKVFNEVRFDKWQLYNQLKEDDTLQQYLPETALLTLDNLSNFLNKYSKVILKPTNLSRGRGISILTTEDNGNLLEANDYRQFTDFKIPISQLADYLHEGKYLSRDYIIQPFLEVPRIDGCPWDIRIVMQKNRWKQWVCNGIECRLAGSGKLITNISSGGKALELNEVLKLAFGTEVDSIQVGKDIDSISMEFCKTMDKTGFHFAEFGIDLAIDQKMKYWFIEANVRPTFNGFKILDDNIYRQICYEPVLYSVSIAGFSWEDNDGTSI